MFHPFYVKNEDGTGQWKAASNLEAGDELLTEDGKKVFVSEVRVEKLEEEIRVYNLEIDEVHTYYVDDGVLVHNMCATNKNKKENAGGGAGESGYGNSIERSGADNIADAAKLKEYYRQAEKYGTGSIKELDDGRFRFYEELKPARTQGQMAGARHVREWNPYTGLKRDWYETLDYNGNIRQVRPDPNITGGVKVHYMFDSEGNYIGNWIPKK